MGNRFAHVHNMGRSLNLMSLTWGVLHLTTFLANFTEKNSFFLYNINGKLSMNRPCQVDSLND